MRNSFSPELVVLLLVLLPILYVAAWFVASLLDRVRMKGYIESRKGGKVLSIRWSPFGPGWFGEKSDRIYKVRYVDGAGQEHLAYCKTSMYTGVYFTEDEIVRSSAAPRRLSGEPSY